jgi:uncharacterized membrane protein YdbT with pleckstrin-like domain
MGYIEKTLAPGEELAYTTRLHWAMFVGPVLLMLVATGLLVAAAVYLSSPVVYAPVVLMVIAALWFLGRTVTFYSTEFGVTSQRLVTKRGLIGIATSEVMLNRIEAVQVAQTIGGRIFNYGDVIVTGTGGTNERFPMIIHPNEFRAKVQEQLTQRN